MKACRRTLFAVVFSLVAITGGCGGNGGSDDGGGDGGAGSSELPPEAQRILSELPSESERAEEVQAIAKLRKIAVATHCHHDVYRRLPPAMSTTADRKPLLSWRVHILPYLDQKELYEKFKLDEPWDSMHNQKLIALMPEVYSTPGSDVASGKTQFLAIRSEHSVIPTPNFRTGKNHSDDEIRSIEYGIGWGMVTDGLKYTIAVVEANKQSAVIWTKPDDLEFDETAPLRGLTGFRKDGFLAVFGNGAAYKIPADLRQDKLVHLMTRDDGQHSGHEFVDRLAELRGDYSLERQLADQKIAEITAMQRDPHGTREAMSKDNLKQIGTAIHDYHDTFKNFPPSRSYCDANGKPLLSWRVYLLPWFDEQNLWRQFRLNEPWDSEHNKKLIAKMPPVYTAPGADANEGKTVYLTVHHEASMFPGTADTRFRDITDGTPNTIMVVEASNDAAVVWTKPDDYDLDPANPMRGLVQLRKGGFLVLMGDKTVRKVPETIDPATLNALFTRNGGERVLLDEIPPVVDSRFPPSESAEQAARRMIEIVQQAKALSQDPANADHLLALSWDIRKAERELKAELGKMSPKTREIFEEKWQHKFKETGISFKSFR